MRPEVARTLNAAHWQAGRNLNHWHDVSLKLANCSVEMTRILESEWPPPKRAFCCGRSHGFRRRLRRPPELPGPAKPEALHKWTKTQDQH